MSEKNNSLGNFVKGICRTIWTLFLIFATLKISGVVSWSWVFTFSPVIFMAGAFVLILVAGALLGAYDTKGEEDDC